jgi:2-polyprenyl-3-methyl-5-hydroxy-6-metoxy-1,4-benzoquinol methylase
MLDVSKKRSRPSERPWYKPALELIKNIKHGKALELGCGLGEFSIKLKKLGFNVFCTDGSAEYVKKVQKLGFKAKKADFNSKLPVKSSSFGLVSCLEVIEHLENAEQFVKEIKRVLKNKGYLLISTPNYAFLGVRLKILFGSTMPDEGYHFRFFTYKSLVGLLEKEGFKIIADNSISFLPFYRITKKTPKGIKVRFCRNLLASKTIILARKGGI